MSPTYTVLTALPQTLNPLDGSAACFPERDTAMQMYRLYWNTWLWADPVTRGVMQVAMDGEQRKITKGHGPLWMSFCKTLPGHAEFWAAQVATLQETLDRNMLG